MTRSMYCSVFGEDIGGVCVEATRQVVEVTRLE